MENKAYKDLLRPIKLEGEAADKFLQAYLEHIDSSLAELQNQERHLLTKEEIKELFEVELDG